MTGRPDGVHSPSFELELDPSPGQTAKDVRRTVVEHSAARATHRVVKFVP